MLSAIADCLAQPQFRTEKAKCYQYEEPPDRARSNEECGNQCTRNRCQQSYTVVDLSVRWVAITGEGKPLRDVNAFVGAKQFTGWRKHLENLDEDISQAWRWLSSRDIRLARNLFQANGCSRLSAEKDEQQEHSQECRNGDRKYKTYHARPS